MKVTKVGFAQMNAEMDVSVPHTLKCALSSMTP